MIRKAKKDKRNRLTAAQIRRSVATSTAIETGEPSEKIEARLASNKRKFPHLTLAN